jgi:periplasmic protein TonB
LNQQSVSVPAGLFSGLSERFRGERGRRAIGLVVALLLEALLLLLLLSMGWTDSPRGKRPTLVSFEASPASEPAPEPAASPEPEDQSEPRADERAAPTLEPLPPRPDEPQAELPPAVLPAVPLLREPAAPPPPPPARQPPAAAAGPVYGPPDNRPAASRDTERVGTAPNGQPLYAARWYREPYPDELRGYLSTATGPGWGLIACRTAPDYRVEDCVGLDEYPRGSMITRAVLAAAWQFKVRPPQLGGRPLVGSWVRIRYEIRVEPR